MLHRFTIIVLLGFVIALTFNTLCAESLDIPARPVNALSGTQVIAALTDLELAAREDRVYAEVTSGNIPDFMRTLVPVTVSEQIKGQNLTAVYYVIPDYLALGSNDDYFLIPLTPIMAQRICDQLQCSLPTRKMVDDIWSAASVKLSPSPIPPSPEMTTIPVFADHNTTVWGQRSAVLGTHPLGELVGGTKKDVVITPQLVTKPGKVAIYGWHYTNGTPIQPLYLGHVDWYADYSHGIRLVKQAMTINGQPTTVAEVLGHADFNVFLSDEGPLSQPRYPVPSETPVPTSTPVNTPVPSPTPTGNLVINGSFEEGFTENVGNAWSTWKTPASDSVSAFPASLNKYDGDFSQYWARGSTGNFKGGIYQIIDVTPDNRYSITAWLMKQSTQPGTQMAFGFDTDGGVNGDAASVQYIDFTSSIDNTWVNYNVEMIASGDKVTIFSKGEQISTDSAKSYFYMDAVSMYDLGPAATPTETPIPSSSGFLISSSAGG